MAHRKLILIGGTSHVGKSTIGRKVADRLGWNYLSTDQLARHPGRPWRDGNDVVREDVVEHYGTLTTEALLRSVMTHYQANVWPIVEAIVRSRLNNAFDFGLVLEGSAILPEPANQLNDERVAAVWLTAPEDLVVQRIRASSNYQEREPQARLLIDAFIQRALAMDIALTPHSGRFIDVSTEDAESLIGALHG